MKQLAGASRACASSSRPWSRVIGAIAAIGAVSRSTGSTRSRDRRAPARLGPRAVVAVVLDDGGLADRPERRSCVGDRERPLPLDRRRQDLGADRAEELQRDERRAGRGHALRRRRAMPPRRRARSSGRARRGRRRAAPPSSRSAPTAARPGQVQHPTGLPNAALQAFAVDPANSKTFYARADERQALPLDRRRASRSSSPRRRSAIPPWAIAIMKGGQFVGGDMDTGPYLSPNGTSVEEDDVHGLARHARW